LIKGVWLLVSKMKLKILILIITLTLANARLCISQCITLNLIKNSNLEEFSCCPNNMGMIDCATYWTQPIVGNSSSEYYNVCGIDSLLFPNLIAYFDHAYFGNGYAGIRTDSYSPPSTSNREYIQGTLSEPLNAGQCYYCEFWVKLFNLENTSPYVAIDALSIYLSDTLTQKTIGDPMDMYFPAQINNQIGRIITDTTNWTLISDTFIAQGGEQYFTVGTFKQEIEINKFFFGTPQTNFSYYFFDNFSLCPCEDTIPPKEPNPVIYIPNIFSPNGDGQNDVFRVRGENIETLQLTAYNRWGNKVFEGSEPQAAWDGTYNGKPCADGVYYYMAAIGFVGGKQEMRKGNVTVVR